MVSQSCFYIQSMVTPPPSCRAKACANDCVWLKAASRRRSECMGSEHIILLAVVYACGLVYLSALKVLLCEYNKPYYLCKELIIDLYAYAPCFVDKEDSGAE